MAFALLALTSTADGAADRFTATYVVQIDLREDIVALGSDDLFVSGPAADRLIALGPLALPALATALRREGPATRQGIVEVLQQVDSAEGTRLLVETAADDDPDVRANALLALGLHGDAAGRAAVEAHLSDPDARARRAAALACHSVCISPVALERLTAMGLHGRAVEESQRSLRTILLGGDAARSSTARAAIEAVALPVLAASDPDAAARTNAALLLGLAGHREAVPILAAVIAKPPRPGVAAHAALALGTVRDASAVAALAPYAASDTTGLRAPACSSLRHLRDQNVATAAAAAAPCPGLPTPAIR